MTRKEYYDAQKTANALNEEMYTFDQVTAWPASDEDTRKLRDYYAEKMQKDQL